MILSTKRLTLCLCIVASVLTSCQSKPQLITNTVFDRTEAQYRIPAIVETHTGRLLAFADHRYDNKDIGGARHLDLVMKYSDDGGLTWSNPEMIVARGGSYVAEDFDCAHGDAAVVCDRESGQLLVMCASGGIGFWESTAEHPIMMGRYYSSDNGMSWSGQEVTSEIYALMPDVAQAFFSSGRICQSRFIKAGSHYRIYSVLATRTGNRVLYSDNFGASWQMLGGVDAAQAAPYGDEAKVEELPNGNVLLSSRVSGGRYFNIFHYSNPDKAEGAWEEAVLANAENGGLAGSANACNGEVLIASAMRSDHSPALLLMQSLPLGPQRTNVALFYKELASVDDYKSARAIAEGWEHCWQFSDTTSAYSTMIQDSKGQILLLYEEDAFRIPETQPDDYYHIRFKKETIQNITNNLYY